MPKEYIRQATIHGDPDTTAHFVEVGWARDRYVDVGTRQGGDFASDIERPGFFVQLDRNGINRLIRTLRKARDQAYGADA